MISNLKNRVRPCCPLHDAPLLFVDREKSRHQFMSCEAYESTEGRPVCLNHIEKEDYDKLLNTLSEIITEESSDGLFANLNGYMFAFRGRFNYEVKVIQHSSGSLDLQITNCTDMR